MHVQRLTMGLAALAVSTALNSPSFAQPAPSEAPGIPVTVAKPQHQDVPVFLSGLGVVSATNTVVLHPRVDGTLDKVAFTEGDIVKAGDVIAQLDARPYQATLDQANAKKSADLVTLANAKRDLARYADLAKNHYAAQQQVDTQLSLVNQLDAAIKGDDATIAAAQLNLDFCRITAPFTGRVGLRLTDAGNFIRSADATNTGIVTLSQIQPISVTFSLPQDQLPAVIAAMAVAKPKVVAAKSDDTVKLDEGVVITVDNSIDASTGTIKVKATFPNQALTLWPGQFVNARLELDPKRNALTLPTSSIQRGPNGLFVYVVKPDNTVAVTAVKLSLDNGSVAVIESGITEADTVVMTGQSRLRPGARVAPSAAAAS